ncbi:MAG: hypothetical protein WAM97_05245 [Acidimicrobiales bacterium]
MSGPPAVTLSTKCWEGDYRTLLTPAGIDELFGPFGPAREHQIVLNRIEDVASAEAMAQVLVESGKIDRWIWAEQRWPQIAKRMGLSEDWFGAAWPYSVPEICELDAATSAFVMHIAGDVRFNAPDGWLRRAVGAFDIRGATVVTATPPAGVEWVLEQGTQAPDGWAETQLFSDQLFLARPSQLVDPVVMRAEHRVASKYPKPGGALTFEARIGAWLAIGGLFTLVDIRSSYLHPVTGREGDSYQRSPMSPTLRPAPEMGPRYPEARSSRATGLVISDNDPQTVGAAVSSLRWCSRVIAVDIAGSTDSEQAARNAGAEIRSWEGPRLPEIARRQLLSDIAGWVVDLEGDQICTGALARKLSSVISDGRVHGIEVSCRSWVGRHRPPRMFLGAPRRMVAYRTDGLTFGEPLDGYPLRPGGRVERIRPKNGDFLLNQRCVDIARLIEESNLRSSWKAENLVLERTPSIRMPLTRLIRSYFGGSWRYGKIGPQIALIDAFEEWSMIQKWRENVTGGAVAAASEFEATATEEITGSD